jgi:hypothetical protein
MYTHTRHTYARALIYVAIHPSKRKPVQLENAVIQRATHAVKVIDFGLTKHIESARTIGIGTPGATGSPTLQTPGS